MKYLIVIEQAGTGFSAYSPDVAGCIATGATREEVEREIYLFSPGGRSRVVESMTLRTEG